MSPLVNPMRTSITSRKGNARVPASMRSHVVGAKPKSTLGEGVGRVSELGSILGGLSLEVGVFLVAYAMYQVLLVPGCH